ncbi:hypothetical protein ABZZ79_07750 [Streptomyces sp. NPDC006458]|uniref:hypothetical protein n=1 Tax=Streptomyces sp. NPDC006458 TaxID=3154302 RepID=UPI0033ABDCB6
MLTARSALVLLLAALSGGVATALSLAAGEGRFRGVLVGLGVAALAVSFFNRLIEHDQARACRHVQERTKGEERG